ncbi:MAG: hypothetical protein DRJ08_03345 [Acidobacteria bacterium]|nr:MAG: hypothetical protein DRJ14_08120 [Acidobacteriota bacterium]RLE22945.1 MAG: hypothetical protein DRJ08_03345 [Acidobacteriota bacterium]
MAKTRINVSLDQDLADFAKTIAAENRTTIADIFTQYLLALKRKTEGKEVEQFLSDPAFQQAMETVAIKLKNGDARWHSYADLFGE